MNYYEVRNMAIDQVVSHKNNVERLSDEYLMQILTIPSIKAIHDNIKDMKRTYALPETSDKDKVRIEKDIKKQMILLRKEFKSNKIIESNLVPKYWCKECKDSGYIDGKICNCIKARTTNLLMSVDGIKPIEKTFDNATFETFDNPDYMRGIYSKAKTFIEKMDTTKYNNFSILGGVGVGKTHLMECMTNLAIANNKYVIYLSAFKLNQMFLNYHIGAIAEKNSIIEPLLNCDLLCIDDLGCEQMLNNVTIPMLTMLINERNMSSKKTIITSNLTIDDIRERYDYRICSRLVDKNVSLTVFIEGKDLRQKI